MVVLGLGLDPHTITAGMAQTRKMGLVVNTNVNLVSYITSEAAVQSIVPALVVDVALGRVDVVRVTGVKLALIPGISN